MRAYIASSWKNQHAVELLTARLREQGHTVVSWVENNYGEGLAANKPMDFEAWMKTDSSIRAFEFDTRGALSCDLFIYLGNAGKDAAAECGIAYASKVLSATRRGPTMWALWAKGEDFGLMRKMFDRWFTRAEDLLKETALMVKETQPA